MGQFDAESVNQTPEAARKEPSPQQLASRNKALHTQRIAIISGCVAAFLILVIVIICLLVNMGSTDDGKILPNVYAAGIDLGGMTRDEARSALRLSINNAVAKDSLAVILPDGVLELNPADTRVSVDVDAVVEAAYSYGRTGSEENQEAIRERAKKSVYTIALLPYMKNLDLEYIYNTVVDFCQTHGNPIPSTASLVGNRPTYDPNYPSSAVVHQVLTITIGTPDYKLNVDDLYAEVLDAYSLNITEVVFDTTTSTKPEPLDAGQLFHEHCSLPQNATKDPDTYAVTPEVYGYGFDIDKVQHLIDISSFGETIEVELMFLYPDITANDLKDGVFEDTLSQFTATGTDSENRNINLELSCQALNGVILSPGETFSFNDTLGRTSAQKGYKSSPVYRNGELSNVIGGGVEQTASALYYCALMADLQVEAHTNNEYVVDYISKGLDVYIEYGKNDLVFTNTTDAPIRIDASANGSSVTIRLIGTDTRNYTVDVITEVVEEIRPGVKYRTMDKDNVYGYTDGTVLEEGITGYRVSVSLRRVHKQTGLEISKPEKVYTAKYSKRDATVVSIQNSDE